MAECMHDWYVKRGNEEVWICAGCRMEARECDACNGSGKLRKDLVSKDFIPCVKCDGSKMIYKWPTRKGE